MNNSSNSSAKLYVPRDSAARSVGADEVAEALQLATVDVDFDIDVVRNGSRGMLWLEPLVEVVTPYGRVGYGPVAPADVAGLLAAGMLDGADHPLRLGVVDELPWLARQTRVTFTRIGVTDPLSTQDYLEHGGLAGLRGPGARSRGRGHGGHRIRIAWPRRRGIPGRHQMEDRARLYGRAEVHLLQRR
jgi:formate dehydrogenase iron-sulfur subunit